MVIISAAFVLGGCTSIHTYVKDWPQDLEVRVHETNFSAINEMCIKDAPMWQKLLGYVAFACTMVDLEAGTCDIHMMDGKPEGMLYEHEYQHCLGGDHDDILQGVYDRWVISGKKRKKKSPYENGDMFTVIERNHGG